MTIATRPLSPPAVTAPTPAWLDPAVYPFRSRWLDIDGSRIHYIDEGEGPPLLFLHANLMWSFTYRNLIRGLRHRFRCIALDYPGFGLSTAAAGYGFGLRDHSAIVERFASALDLQGVTLYVHDAGGAIGLRVATVHPERFRALIVTDTFAWPLDAYPKVARFVGFAGGPLFGSINGRTNLLSRVTVRDLDRRRPLLPAERAALLGPFPDRASRAPIHTLFRALVRETAYLEELEQGLDRLRQLPALIIFGEHDPVRAAGFQTKWEQILPRHTSLTLPGAAHFGHEEMPDEIVAAIERWWDTAVAPGPG